MANVTQSDRDLVNRFLSGENMAELFAEVREKAIDMCAETGAITCIGLRQIAIGERVQADILALKEVGE